MSDKIKLNILSEYKIDECDNKISGLINSFYKYWKKKEYYKALYSLENLILQDGTSQKYNYIFLNYIISHIKELVEDIKKVKKEQKKKENFFLYKEDKAMAYLNDVHKYDFYYLRNCFDKYEITLDNQDLEKLHNKKIKYNKKIMADEDKYLNQEYDKFIKKISSEGNLILPTKIYETINNFNKKIKNKDFKLFYLYKYLDYKLIINNCLFKYLENDSFYLDQFYFGAFDILGIAIGYCDNINLIYRYIFSLIKNKINENEKEFKNSKKLLKFIFTTFNNILKSKKRI